VRVCGYLYVSWLVTVNNRFNHGNEKRCSPNLHFPGSSPLQPCTRSPTATACLSQNLRRAPFLFVGHRGVHAQGPRCGRYPSFNGGCSARSPLMICGGSMSGVRRLLRFRFAISSGRFLPIGRIHSLLISRCRRSSQARFEVRRLADALVRELRAVDLQHRDCAKPVNPSVRSDETVAPPHGVALPAY
jgi:hypothetical protein